MEEIDIWLSADVGVVDPWPTMGWTLYYDETNNYRKFSIDSKKDGYVNDPRVLFNDFIIGGIALPPNTDLDISGLRGALGIPQNVELKARHLFSTDDFLHDAGSKRILAFLRWLSDTPALIHYFCSNNIYDAVIEVVDKSIENDYSMITAPLHWEMKDQLYILVEKNPMDFLSILCKYRYPEVDPDQEGSFCKEMVGFIEENRCCFEAEEFYLELLRQNLKTASRIETKSTLNFGKEGEIISDYSAHYWGVMMDSPGAMHVFDHEVQIERRLEEIALKNHREDYSLYRFVDSKNCPLIQIADLTVGLLGRMFNWIDGLTSDEIKDIVSGLNNRQLEAFHLINDLVDKTHIYCQYLIRNMCPTSKSRRRMDILQLLANSS